MQLTTQGLVLREVNYKESDKILTVLTQDMGKLTISARGSRKKGGGISAAAQMLVWSEMTLYEYRQRWSLKEAVTNREFRGVREDLESYALACYFAEIIDQLAPEQLPVPELLALILNALYALENLDRPPVLIKAAFELRAMCLSGYEPDLRGCAVCGAPEPDRFNISQGVLQCAACRTEEENDIRLPMSAGTRAALRYLDSAPSSRVFSFRLAEPSLSELGQITESYLCTRLERGFSTLDFYKSLFL